MQALHTLARNIRLLIMDVDGVLTDGRIFLTAQAEELKSFDTRDGHGLKMLQSTGVKLAMATGRTALSAEHRARDLGIDYYYAGISDKLCILTSLLTNTGLTTAECAYIGDDVLDLPVMIRVGFAVTVPGAPALVRQRAHYITDARGGQGAVRELCELILQAQGHFDSLMARYLE